MPSFKDVTKTVESTKQEPADAGISVAASKILAAHTIKDKRIAFRINSATYDQFSTINRKRGAASSSVINMLIAEYILEHKDLLDIDE